MGWFKKEDKKQSSEKIPELPKLPSLPSLDFPKIDSSNLHPKQEPSKKQAVQMPEHPTQIHKLPNFSSGSVSDKFSQRVIKEAVESDDEEPEEFDEDNLTPINPRTQRIGYKADEGNPVFVRLDKFEESLEILDSIKKDLVHIEKFLEEIKKVRLEEEKELSLWEKEVEESKKKIAKIDEEFFSKIE